MRAESFETENRIPYNNLSMYMKTNKLYTVVLGVHARYPC